MIRDSRRILRSRCRANVAHIRQSRPDSGPGFQVKVLKIPHDVTPWLPPWCTSRFRAKGARREICSGLSPESRGFEGGQRKIYRILDAVGGGLESALIVRVFVGLLLFFWRTPHHSAFRISHEKSLELRQFLAYRAGWFGPEVKSCRGKESQVPKLKIPEVDLN